MNEQDKVELCARVKQARLNSGLEQAELGEMLDPPVEDRTIRNYESVRPPFRYLRQIAEITGSSYEWLLRGEEPPTVVLAPDATTDLHRTLEGLRDKIEAQVGALGRSIAALDDRLETVEDRLARIIGLLEPLAVEAKEE